MQAYEPPPSLLIATCLANGLLCAASGYAHLSGIFISLGLLPLAAPAMRKLWAHIQSLASARISS